ncbi:MAG TPA: right-handed parallel beta-helix repeat-containing protein [Nitrososphaeraceae archaeon]|jgi:hypothetical protein
MRKFDITTSPKNQRNVLVLFLVLSAPLLFATFSWDDTLGACITYSSSSRTITVSCTAATHLKAVNTAVNNANVLKQESTGVWLLSANILVAKGGNLVIDSTDGSWLKIRSDGASAFGLKNSGTLKIDSIKITSWNTVTKNYASAGSSGQTPRGYISTLSSATGKTNILNSELAYLGYSKSGTHGLDYYGGAGSLIQNNQIHHLWRAFYSSGVGGLTFTKNVVHDSMEYGIDPHSGTHDMYITYNKAYNNNHGIICSVACYNMHITNNELYNNQRDGIFMDAGSHHTVIANNVIHDEDVAIQLPSLSYSQIFGNTITNSKYGIEFETQIGSSFDEDGRCVPYGCVSINNQVYDNRIKATSIGLWAKNGASSNTFSRNTIDGPNGDRGIVVDGPTTSNNVFSDNHISNARYSVRITGGNTNSKFINNHLDTTASSGEYTLASASALKLESNQFSSDVIRALDSTSIPVSISKSGKVSVLDGSTTKTYDTNIQAYVKTLRSAGKITVTSLSSAASTLAQSSISSLSLESPSGASLEGAVGFNSSRDENGPITRTQGTANNIESKAQQAQQEAQESLNKVTSSDANLKVQEIQVDRSDDINTKNSDKSEKVKNVVPKEDTKNDKAEKLISPDYNNDRESLYNKNRPRDNSRVSIENQNQENTMHSSELLLNVRPGESKLKYDIIGELWDKTESKPLEGMRIQLEVNGQTVRAGDIFTKNDGSFTTTISLPDTDSAYKVQAYFTKSVPYDSAVSEIVTIKSRNEAISHDDSNVARNQILNTDN